MILVRSMKCCFISFCKWVMKRSELKHHHHLDGLQTDVEHNWARVGGGGVPGGTFVILANILLIVLTKS